MNDTMVVLGIKNKGKKEQKKLRKSRVRNILNFPTPYLHTAEFPLL